MRGLNTPVKQIRRQIFTEIAKIGFYSTDENLIHDIEAIPYKIVEEEAKYRDSIYRERAVASERVRLAMGMSLRPKTVPFISRKESRPAILTKNTMSRRSCR